MRKIICIFTIILLTAHGGHATTRDARLTNTTGYNYNYMYPYMNNQMRTNLNPGVTTSQSLNPINSVVKTIPMGTQRRVVPRAAKRGGATSAARSATTSAISSNTARVANRADNRRVVARRGGLRGTPEQTIVQNQSTANRTDSTNVNLIQSSLASTERVSSTRCLADYTECMNMYCERPKTEYNRCYCSAKLSQIDSEYQPAIEKLINQIITLKTKNQWTDAEMNEYWMDTIGKYTGDNSWVNINNALDIDWSDMESRVRGQNAFNTGHEYCIQHLRGCFYMAGNLRDVYRSDIARDCAIYEQSLQNIKNAAESIVESYK